MKILLIVAPALLCLTGCVSNHVHDSPPKEPKPVAVISDADILKAAEPAMQAKYPAEFEKYKPYLAKPIPLTDVWEVRHAAIPTPIGSPKAIVRNDGRVLEIFLTDREFDWEAYLNENHR